MSRTEAKRSGNKGRLCLLTAGNPNRRCSVGLSRESAQKCVKNWHKNVSKNRLFQSRLGIEGIVRSPVGQSRSDNSGWKETMMGGVWVGRGGAGQSGLTLILCPGNLDKKNCF